MNCDEAIDLILERKNQTLTEEQKNELQHHLNNCKQCNAYLQFLNTSLQPQVLSKEEFWKDFQRNVMSKIQTRETFPEKVKRLYFKYLPCPFTAIGLEKVIKLSLLVLLILSISALFHSEYKQTTSNVQTIDFHTTQDSTGLKIYHLKLP